MSTQQTPVPSAHQVGPGATRVLRSCGELGSGGRRTHAGKGRYESRRRVGKTTGALFEPPTNQRTSEGTDLWFSDPEWETRHTLLKR